MNIRILETDKTQFTPHFETGQNCLDLSPILFTRTPTRTRPDKTAVLSVSAYV